MERIRRSGIINQIKGYASALIHSLMILDERRYIFEPLIKNTPIKKALAKKFKDRYGALGYNHLAPLIAQDAIRDISRIFLDDDKRAGSFTNLFRKCSVEKVYAALRENFRQIPDKWHTNPEIPGLTLKEAAPIVEEWKEKDRKEFEESFDEGWNIAMKAIESLKSDPVAQKIKTFRDKYHAHLEMTPLGKDPGPFDVNSLELSFNDIFDFLNKYIPPVFDLVRVITGSVHDIKEFSSIHRKCGLDMWCVLSGVNYEIVEKA
jgi:hypothetical protein